MPHLGRYLSEAFRKELDLPKHGECLVKDGSRLRQAPARWARRDFILGAAMRVRLMPGAQLGVHSFELKAEYGATGLAVCEALPQTRFTHFGDLVWHLPKDSLPIRKATPPAAVDGLLERRFDENERQGARP
jgi:hypothetical protein